MSFFTGGSIFKKFCMAISGLLMILFLFGHLSGNFLLYVGKEEFNAYASLLNSTKLIYLAEFGLLLILVVHVYTAICLTRENRKARPTQYLYKLKEGRSTWASSHMMHSGMIILLFLIIHLWTLKFGVWDNSPDSSQTLYDLTLLRFSSFIYSLGYLIAMILMGFHLSHAFHSSLRTLGIESESYAPKLKKIGTGIAILLSVGFSGFPVIFYIRSLFV